MSTVQTTGFIEDLAVYLAANYPGGFTEGVDLLIGALIELEDDESFQSTSIRLAIFQDPGATIVPGRVPKQRTPIRFITKSDYSQGAVNLAGEIHDWLINRKRLLTTSFIAWAVQATRSPALFIARDDGTYLADFSIEYLVLRRT